MMHLFSNTIQISAPNMIKYKKLNKYFMEKYVLFKLQPKVDKKQPKIGSMQPVEYIKF